MYSVATAAARGDNAPLLGDHLAEGASLLTTTAVPLLLSGSSLALPAVKPASDNIPAALERALSAESEPTTHM